MSTAIDRFESKVSSVYSRVRVDRAGFLGALALSTYARGLSRDYYSTSVGWHYAETIQQIQFDVLAIAAECLSLSGARFVTDSGRVNRLYRFGFGAYGDTLRWVLSGSVEDALEAAADTLPPGIFTEPDLQAAAEDLGVQDTEEIWEHATADLTYTESGYIASWEWTVDDATAEEIREWLLDQIDRGRAKIDGAYVDFFPAG